MQVGFIDTGTMGNPMVRCLLEAGHRVMVHDLRREATTNLCAAGAYWAETPRAVAQESEVVFTSLPGPAQVEHGGPRSYQRYSGRAPGGWGVY